MADLSTDQIAFGDYEGSIEWRDLEVWCMKMGVCIEMRLLPWGATDVRHKGVYEATIEDVGTSCYSTLMGAIHILHHHTINAKPKGETR